MNGWRMPDLAPLFYLAIFGLACAALLLIGAMTFLIWFVVNHVQII